ncbi:FAD binding domain-containing protein [Aminobacter sp. P9b]|uniref:FAD binding domain-containing protein n=1 Tax=Aminobacter sp. P9b TaxID=3133697 RepID=UPI0032457B71
MKPTAFDYIRPTSLPEALAILAEHSDDVAILAGGQSLMPLLNFRMSRPALVLDINDISELQQVRCENDTLYVGSMVRHCRVEQEEIFRSTIPLMSEAMTSVAHIQIKTRGTLGGNLCNAHPASEMPAVITALGASMVCKSEKRGERVLTPEEFFEGALQNGLQSDELLCEIRIPVPSQYVGWAFEEVARRHGDFAQCGAAVLIGAEDRKIDYARIALCSIGETPIRFHALEQWLIGRPVGNDLPADVKLHCREILDIAEDSTMTAENRAKLASAVTSRAIARAADRIVHLDVKRG